MNSFTYTTGFPAPREPLKKAHFNPFISTILDYIPIIGGKEAKKEL
jgi:hypothetical protein